MMTRLETQLARELMVALAVLRKGDAGERKKSRWTQFWEFIQPVLTTLIPSLVLFLIGYFFLEAAKQGLEERRLGTESAKELRDLIKELLSDDIEARTADATAFAIAGFGRYGVAPLVVVLQAGGEARPLAAEKGIVAAALIDRPYTCGVLADVLANRSRGFTWMTHKYVVRAAARIGCDDDKMRSSLVDYQRLLAAGEQRYANAVDATGADSAQLQALREEVGEALKRASTSSGRQ